MLGRFRVLLVVLTTVSAVLVVSPVAASDPVCTITGTEGDDVLTGTPGDDVICGLGGDDTIDAGDGADVVFGGTGADVIRGGAGADELHGNEDSDEIYGDEGDDWIGGGQDDDVLFGGDGADVIEGKLGADVIYGGAGDDELHGNENPDQIFGEDGDDWLGGGKGPDELHGGDGDDILEGKKGDDLLIGGLGVDTADGNEGSDTCAAETEVSCEEDPSTPTAVTFTRPTDGATVFHTETITVTVEPAGAEGTVEFSADAAVIGSVAIVDGSASIEWDTTTIPDGDTSVTAAVFDVDGNPAVSAGVSVSVGNGATGTERIESDFEQGAISVDEYVEWGIWSLTHPALLDDRYEAGGDSGTTDATPDGLGFLASWDELDPDTQQRIRDFVTVQEVEITQQAQGAAAQTQAAGGPWTECGDVAGTLVVRVVFAKAFRCVHPVEAGQGNQLFDVFYTVEGLDDPSILAQIWVAVSPDVAWAETVADTDVGGSFGVPDDVETVSTSLLESYAVYGDGGLGYSLPEAPARVAVHQTRGMVIPDLSLLGGASPVIQVDNNSLLDYLPRHELFHSFQYEYFGLDDLRSLDLTGLLWWMEATAEWAAHKVGESLASPAEANRYTDRLDEFLLEPWRRIDTFQREDPKRQYGVFILAEYFEQRFGPLVVQETWEQLITTNVVDDIGIVLGNQTPASTWEQELPTFWKAAYLLLNDQSDDLFIDDEANGSWRVRLRSSLELRGEDDWWADQLGLKENARLRRDHRRLGADVQATSTVTIEGGGARFVELVPASPAQFVPAQDGTIQIGVSGSQGLSVEVIRFEKYPEAICETLPVPLSIGPNGLEGSVTIVADSACPFATLIAMNPDPQANPVTFTWDATFKTSVNLLTNPGFESGDLSGWITFGNDLAFETITFLVHSGGFAAAFEVFGATPAGFTQTVQVAAGEPYSASMWFNRFTSGGAQVALQITQPDGTVIAQDSATVFGSGWQRLSVTFTAPSEMVEFRAVLLDFFGEDTRVAFDDAMLVEASVSNLVNTGFDDGLDGWSVVGVADGTVTPADVGGVTTVDLWPQTGQPVGIEQLFDGYGFNAAIAIVSAQGGDAQVTLDILRLDGTLVNTWTETIGQFQGWVTMGGVGWLDATEDILVYRLTTTGPGTVQVDSAFVGLAT